MLTLESMVELRSDTSVSAAAFHPFRPQLLSALGSSVVVSEGGFTVATLPTDDRVDFLFATSSHALVVALTRSETAYLWDANDYSLLACLSVAESGERRSFAAACVSAVHPFLFYARQGPRQNQIHVVDLTSLRTPMPRLEGGRRAVTSLAAHPSKPLLAAGHVDGSVRLWDYQLGTSRSNDEYTSIAVNSAKFAPSPAGITLLALHPTLDYVLAASPMCLVVAYRVRQKNLAVAAARVLNATRASSGVGFLTSMHFHAKLGFLMTTFSKGKIQSWRIVHSDDKPVLIRSSDLAGLPDFSQLLRAAIKASAPPFALAPRAGDDVMLRSMVSHPHLSHVTFVREAPPPRASSTSSHASSGAAADAALFAEDFAAFLHPVFAIGLASAFDVPTTCTSSQVHVPVGGLAQAAKGELFYVKRGQLMVFSLETNENAVVRPIPTDAVVCSVAAARAGPVIVLVEQEAEGVSAPSDRASVSITLHTAKLATSGSHNRNLVRSSALVIARDGVSMDSVEARDAAFLSNSGRDYALLGSDGLSLSVYRNGRCSVHSGWVAPLDRVFAAPLHGNGDGLLYASSAVGALEFAAVCMDPRAEKPLHPSATHRLALRKRERAVQVTWQQLPADGAAVRGPVALVRTTERLLVVDARLSPLVQVDEPATSALWCEAVVVFTTLGASTVQYLCLDGHRGVLSSSDDRGTTLGVVLRDRLLFVAPSLSDAQVCSLAVWPLECAARAALALQPVAPFDAVDALTAVLDGSRVSADLLRLLLARGLHRHAGGLAGLCTRLPPEARLAALYADRRFAECFDLVKAYPQQLGSHPVAQQLEEAARAPQAVKQSPDDVTSVDLSAPTPEPERVEGWLAQKMDLYRDAASMLSPRDPASAMLHAAAAAATTAGSRDGAAGLARPFLAVPAGFSLPNLDPLRLPDLSGTTACSSLMAQPLLRLDSARGVSRLPPPSRSLPALPLDAGNDDSDSDLIEGRVSESMASSEPPSPRGGDDGPSRPAATSLRAAFALTDDSTRVSSAPADRLDDDALASRASDFLQRAGASMLRGSDEGTIHVRAALNELCQLAEPLDYVDLFCVTARFKLALQLSSRALSDPGRACLCLTLVASLPLSRELDLKHLRAAVEANTAQRNHRLAMALAFFVLKQYPSENVESLGISLTGSSRQRDQADWCASVEGDITSVRFCARSLRLVTASDRVWTCSHCSSVVMVDQADQGSKCSVCTVGKLIAN